MDNQNIPFVVISPDGFEPRLTLCTMTDGVGCKTAIIGQGSKADIATLLSTLITAALDAGLSVDIIAAACATAMREADKKGIQYDKGSFTEFAEMD